MIEKIFIDWLEEKNYNRPLQLSVVIEEFKRYLKFKFEETQEEEYRKQFNEFNALDFNYLKATVIQVYRTSGCSFAKDPRQLVVHLNQKRR